MSEHRIYRVTSIGRPIDPKYPTNKAILILMVVAALIAGGVALLQGVGGGASATGALKAFLVVVVWLLALQTGLQGPGAIEVVMPVLAVMAGVVLAGLTGRYYFMLSPSGRDH